MSQPISIVVCTYNRLAYLKHCVEALLRIEHSNYEIIIIDDGSTDGTREYLNTVAFGQFRVVRHEKNRGKSHALNTGIAAARHDIIAFTDDDCTPSAQWLTEFSKTFSEPGTDFVIGETIYREDGYAGYFPERLVSNQGARWPMGCNIAFRKKIFEQCGGYDERYFPYNNEDSEMAIRAVTAGLQYKRNPAARVYHQAMHWNVRSLLRSARNASVWVLLKKQYPHTYTEFGPPVRKGVIINAEDYFYILTAPIFIPLLFARYLLHGKTNLLIFFTKWPVYLFLRRFYVYKEVIKQKQFML